MRLGRRMCGRRWGCSKGVLGARRRSPVQLSLPPHMDAVKASKGSPGEAKLSGEKGMTKQEAIEAACSIVARAHHHIGYKTASDCFCGGGSNKNPTRYLNEGIVLKFVADAVDEKIARDLEMSEEMGGAPIFGTLAADAQECG